MALPATLPRMTMPPDPAVRDDVAFARRRAADGRVAAEDGDAAVLIAERERAGGVGADEVALDDDAGDAAADRDPVDGVGGDDVARSRSRATDHGAVGIDEDSIVEVAERSRPGDVRADEVSAGDEVRPAVEPDAVAAVARDDVAGRGRGAADRDVHAGGDVDAGLVSREGVAARGVRADEVALDQVSRAAVAARAEVDALHSVARDQVARGGSRAADRDVRRPVVDLDPEVGVGVRDRARWDRCR